MQSEHLLLNRKHVEGVAHDKRRGHVLPRHVRLRRHVPHGEEQSVSIVANLSVYAAPLGERWWLGEHGDLREREPLLAFERLDGACVASQPVRDQRARRRVQKAAVDLVLVACERNGRVGKGV